MQRESDFANGVSTYKSQWDQAKPLLDAITPFQPILQQNGLNPAQWIQTLGNAHATLVYGTPEQKIQMFSQLANDYGVDLNTLTGQEYNPQFSMLAQELGQIKNQWQQFQTQREQQAQQQVLSEIDQFKADKPHFEQVRESMIGLLQSGMANDLQTAYDKAIRLHDDVWQQHLAEQQREVDAKRHETVVQAKAKAVSPKSVAPTGQMATGGGNKSLRDQLAEQFAAQEGRF